MNNEWTKAEDNLFNANHRNAMIRNHHGTMASHYTVEQIEKEYNERTKGLDEIILFEPEPDKVDMNI
jgi:hypothetical protein